MRPVWTQISDYGPVSTDFTCRVTSYTTVICVYLYTMSVHTVNVYAMLALEWASQVTALLNLEIVCLDLSSRIINGT